MLPTTFDRRLWMLMGTVCLALVLTAIILTAVKNLHPCYLCVFQRFLYFALAFSALAAAWGRGAVYRTGVSMAVVAALAGVVTAGFQVWLQAQPAAAFECGAGDNPIERFVVWLDSWVPVIFHATGVCSSIEMSIFSVSIAQWSLLGFVGALIGAAWAWKVRRA